MDNGASQAGGQVVIAPATPASSSGTATTLAALSARLVNSAGPAGRELRDDSDRAGIEQRHRQDASRADRVPGRRSQRRATDRGSGRPDIEQQGGNPPTE